MTTPKKVNVRVPPVATLALPSGACLATSDKYTPFQPMADAPNTIKTIQMPQMGKWGSSRAVAKELQANWDWVLEIFQSAIACLILRKSNRPHFY